MFAHEVPDHFDDHPAVMRRILPPLVEHLAGGRFSGLDAYDLTGLGRSGPVRPVRGPGRGRAPDVRPPTRARAGPPAARP